MGALAVADVPRGTLPADLATQLLRIPLDAIDVGDNVRVNVEAIDELAASVAEHGVLQPVKVVEGAGGRYRLVWGQRRVLAARQAGLTEIPAIVELEHDVVADPGAARSIEQLVENLHRADLNPIDRARAMRDVVAAGVSQADLARKLGIAPSTVANDLGILEAPERIQALVEQGELTPSHAKAMKGLAPKTQEQLAKRVVDQGLSAHATEDLVQRERRAADQEREHRAAEAKQRQRQGEEMEASIAEWAAKKVPTDALIVVASGYSYSNPGGREQELLKRILAAGYTNARLAKNWNETSGRPSGGVCDCSAWVAKAHESGRYEGGAYVYHSRASIARACVDPKHQEAKEAAARKAERDKYSLQEKVQAHVKRTAAAWAVPDARAIAIDRILAESILWEFIGYRLPEWAVKRGGVRNKPWATLHALSDEDLAKELAAEVAGDFRDKAGYHVDWPDLATEFGLVDPTPPAPKSGRRSAATKEEA